MDCSWAGVRIGTALGRSKSAATIGGVDLALSLSLVVVCPFRGLPGLDGTVRIVTSMAVVSG